MKTNAVHSPHRARKQALNKKRLNKKWLGTMSWPALCAVGFAMGLTVLTGCQNKAVLQSAPMQGGVFADTSSVETLPDIVLSTYSATVYQPQPANAANSSEAQASSASISEANDQANITESNISASGNSSLVAESENDSISTEMPTLSQQNGTQTLTIDSALSQQAEEAYVEYTLENETPLDIPRISVWDKMRADFSWVHYQDNTRIDHEIKRYTRNPDYLPTIASRAQYFLHFIVEELNRRNMPVELALLPVVESAFNPYAVSSSQAVGLWQFIRGTGDIFQLTRNEWVDQRRNAVASTMAAIDYLESLMNQFNGSVDLALAAYNAGPSTVRKAQNANIRKGLPSDYWSLKLPRETMDYVPRLIAVAKVVNAPYQYQVNLPDIEYTPYFETLTYTGPVSLPQVAQAYNLNYEHLHFLNAQYTYKVTPAGLQPIVVPIAHIEQAAVDSSQTHQFTDYTHITSNKDITLTDLSIKKRVSLPILTSLNPSFAAEAPITAGTPIHFPDLTPANEHMAKIVKYQKPGKTRYHVVRKGDTLWNISRRYNVSHKDLAAWNNLSTSSILSIGKKLKVKQQKLKPVKKHYVVAQGDTLWSVAKRFDVSISDLRQWNSLQDNSLSIGQRLTMIVHQ